MSQPDHLSEESKSESVQNVSEIEVIEPIDETKRIEVYFENSGLICLWRLIESNHFGVSMALTYFLTIEEHEVIKYIIKKLFSLQSPNIAWYLMQLIHLYLYAPQFQELFYDGLRVASSQDLNFSLLCTWFLEAYLLGSTPVDQSILCLLKKLLNSILSSWCKSSKNDISLFISERSFMTELVLISRRLRTISSKTSRVHRLHSELLTLDRSLSQAVFIPIASMPDHVVVRIPYKDSSVLNSKDKAPYLVYIEVIEQENATKNHPNVTLFRSEEFKKFIKTRKTNENRSFHHSTSLSTQTEIDHDEIDSLLSCSLNDGVHSTWSKASASDVRKQIKSASDGNQRFRPSMDVDDPSSDVVSEPWQSKLKRIKESSPFGNIVGWNLYSIIVKYGDDLRQDYLAYQFLKKCKEIWESENISSWVRPYSVVITESQAGIIEAITDAVSIHQIKSRTGCSLEEYFRKQYGYHSEGYSNAKKEFIRSLAGYSLFQYIFQVRDRHNGNILLDRQGHIIHIDFGFILGQSPKNISFETSPFKMSLDFIELLEGSSSDFFLYFKSLMFLGLMALRKHMDQLLVLVDTMKVGDTLPCLGKNGQAVAALKSRFLLDMNDKQIHDYLDKLIYQSTNSLTTLIYDKFQYYTNGIRI